MEKKKIIEAVQAENIDLCANILKEKGLNIAFAESATAGRAMAEFSLIEKAGDFLKGGLVCYDAGVKEDILKVPHSLILNYTAESAEVTQAAANGLKSLMDADVYVAITGLTSPGGSETKDKPVGTIFVHYLYNGKEKASQAVFDGEGESIVIQAVNYIATTLFTFLQEE
jgi:nicotinamide-nucleotide amidase